MMFQKIVFQKNQNFDAKLDVVPLFLLNPTNWSLPREYLDDLEKKLGVASSYRPLQELREELRKL